MDSFISNVVNSIIKTHKNYADLILVTPSQRACIFLKEDLLKKIPSTTFFPKIYSIENYIQELADIKLINTTQLLFEFYSIYKEQIPNSTVESIDVFTQWASTALQDFNEIDSYLINPTDFFSNLRDIQKLNRWFQNKTPSQLATDYLHFFENLNSLYTTLYSNLKRNKFGYQGLIYREATRNLEFYIQQSNKHIIFIGFNALNKAEEVIFTELLNHGLASVYWDAPETFMNSSNPAGSFLRKYKAEWNFYKDHSFHQINPTVNTKRKVQIIGAPKNITQIKYAGEILSKFKNFHNKAFVLADENLLSLVLNSLPDKVKNINITMGYPLKDIPLTHLFDKFFKLHLNQQKFNKTTDSQFYYKDVLNLFSDAYLNKLMGIELQSIILKIKKDNSLFISYETLEKYLLESENKQGHSLLNLLKIPDRIESVISQCLLLITKFKPLTTGIEKEYLYRFYKVFRQIETLNSSYKHIKDLKTLVLFFNQILQQEKLSFQGEPLQGLQLMGMLETRALDFETLIITSLNEGILPSGKTENSFIPFDVKKHFGLPTYEEKDAIYSYHFQRLLHRANDVYLIYNTETDGYGSGEKSRFLTQLEIEYPTLVKTLISPKVQTLNFPLLEIKKTPDVIQKLNTLFKNGISPSALATYIYNPIQFYEQKVLRIKENEEVEETIASNTMGSVIHETLETLYTPYLGKFLSSKAIDEMQLKSKGLLIKYFKKNYPGGTIELGKNKLIFEVCENLVHKFLQQELNSIKKNKRLKIVALEKKFAMNLVIDQLSTPIKLVGIVDRIDELDGKIRIIDYKTGKVEAKDLKLSNFEEITTAYKFTKAMQVMLYTFMYMENSEGNIPTIQSGIISFKNLRSGFLKINFSESYRGVDTEITRERLNNFITEIKALILEILDPTIPFTQNQNLPF